MFTIENPSKVFNNLGSSTEFVVVWPVLIKSAMEHVHVRHLTFYEGLNNENVTTNLPCIWTRNSVLILLADSLSFSLLEPHKESTSSTKMMAGLLSRAISKSCFTSLQVKTNKKKSSFMSAAGNEFDPCILLHLLSNANAFNWNAWLA